MRSMSRTMLWSPHSLLPPGPECSSQGKAGPHTDAGKTHCSSGLFSTTAQGPQGIDLGPIEALLEITISTESIALSCNFEDHASKGWQLVEQMSTLRLPGS